MSVPSGPYLLEFRAARAMMTAGNLGPSKLVEMLDAGEIFFFEGDKKDFGKCPDCSSLLKSHPKCFLRCKPDDLPRRAALAHKLVDSGHLTASKKIAADDSLRFTAIACREELCCVAEPNQVFWDPFAVFQAAQISSVTTTDFLKAML